MKPIRKALCLLFILAVALVISRPAKADDPTPADFSDDDGPCELCLSPDSPYNGPDWVIVYEEHEYTNDQGDSCIYIQFRRTDGRIVEMEIGRGCVT